MKKTIFLITLLSIGLALGACRNTEPSDGDADVDGDGDVDADADGDSDSDGTPGCFPPLDLCDAVAQCGCADGQYCDVTFDGATAATNEVCIGNTGGTGVHGETGCMPGTCAPGHMCANEADPDGNPIAVCRKWCLEEEDCNDYPGSQCTNEICYVDGDGNPIGCIGPYMLCTPEDEGLGVGHAEFSVCTGYADDCPGNPPFPYTIDVAESGENARCDIDPTVTPALLSFSLRSETESVSITAYELEFDFAAAGGGFTAASAGDLTRFSFFLPDSDTYSTELINSPPGRGSCEVMVHYLAETEGFELEFTCNHIMTAFTDSQLVTMEDDEMGPGTLSIDGCAIAE